MHEGGCNSANEYPLGLSLYEVECEFDCLGNLRVLERKEGGDVDPVPRLEPKTLINALGEFDLILLAVGAVILGNFHEAQRRIFVLIPRLQQQNFLTRHS